MRRINRAKSQFELVQAVSLIFAFRGSVPVVRALHKPSVVCPPQPLYSYLTQTLLTDFMFAILFCR